MAAEGKFFTVKGDLLEAPEDFRCHQCNCVTTKAVGLAHTIFERYYTVNTYKGRLITRSIPGTADVFLEERVVNLYGQYAPGKCNPRDYPQRRVWFWDALMDMLEKVPKGSTFAFPYKIGCGYAGGEWLEYEAMLQKFSEDPRVAKVVIYSI